MESAGKTAPVVLAQDVAVELGSPRRASVNMTLWTSDAKLVEDGLATLIGPDLNQANGQELDYAQVVMVGLGPAAEADPFKLDAGQYLGRRLPGVMARMVPGRLWLRASEDALAAGADFSLLAAALMEAAREAAGGESVVECCFITRDRASVEGLAGLASEASILSGEHKKIALGVDGDYECEELDCDSCDERPVCDQIREAVTIKRRRRDE